VLVLGLVLVLAISYLGGPGIEVSLVLWSAGFATLAVAAFTHGRGAGATAVGSSFVFLVLLGMIPLVSAIHDALRGPRIQPSSELVLSEVVRAAGGRRAPS
jgi:hypothetical protein